MAFDRVWTLCAPEEGAHVDVHRWSHQARTFFDADLTIDATAEVVAVMRRGDHASTRVRVRSRAFDEATRARAMEGVARIGGAGFDALIARARRTWEIDDVIVDGEDPRAPLVLAAIASSVLLAPIVPPEGDTIFGVKGARLRLEALGWPKPIQSPA